MSTDTVTNYEVVECGLGEPWGNFDGTKGVMPVSELEGHLEPYSAFNGLLEVTAEEWASIKTLDLALL